MNIIITGRSMKVTPSIKERISSMIEKHKKLLDSSTKIQVELSKSAAHQGVNSDSAVDIGITMPEAFIQVKQTGSDFYTIIDLIDPILRRRLIRYHDHKTQWEGRESWRMQEIEELQEELTNIEEDKYADDVEEVEPVITRYKQFSQNSPMHPAEAIQRMELLGHEAFLFKNIETNKYSAVYRRSDGTYGLIEPKEL